MQSLQDTPRKCSQEWDLSKEFFKFIDLPAIDIIENSLIVLFLHDKELAGCQTQDGGRSSLSLVSYLCTFLFLDSEFAKTIPRAQLQDRSEKLVGFPPIVTLKCTDQLLTLVELSFEGPRNVICNYGRVPTIINCKSIIFLLLLFQQFLCLKLLPVRCKRIIFCHHGIKMLFHYAHF